MKLKFSTLLPGMLVKASVTQVKQNIYTLYNHAKHPSCIIYSVIYCAENPRQVIFVSEVSIKY